MAATAPSGVVQIAPLIRSTGPEVLFPVLLFVLALLVGVDRFKTVKSAIQMGVGFIGTFLIIDLFRLLVMDTVLRLSRMTGGVTPEYVDLCWQTAAVVAFGVIEIGFPLIPAFVVLNAVLFHVGFAFTLDIDIWDFWHYAIAGSILYIMTGDWWYALGVTLIYGMLVLVIADWFQPALDERFDIPGVAIPHGFTAPMAVLAVPINELVRRTPITRFEVDAATVRTSYHTVTQNAIVGFVLGAAIGLLAYADPSRARRDGGSRSGPAWRSRRSWCSYRRAVFK